MKFTQVNEEQIRQAGEAVETIIKLKKILARERLINKVLGKDTFGYSLTPVSILG